MHPVPRHHVLWKPSFLLHHGYGRPPHVFTLSNGRCAHNHLALHDHGDACLCSGGGDCDPGESHENDVVLFGRSEGRRERVALDSLPYSSYRVRHKDVYLYSTVQSLKCLLYCIPVN